MRGLMDFRYNRLECSGLSLSWMMVVVMMVALVMVGGEVGGTGDGWW